MTTSMPLVKDQRKTSSKKESQLFYQNSLVIFFILIGAFLYWQAIDKKNSVLRSLDEHILTLEQEKGALLETKDDLLLQTNSQSDPAWIQMTLMKRLGLLPEGQLKVYFSQGED